MASKLTAEESEALSSGWLMPSAVGKVSPAMRRYHGITDTSANCGTGYHPQCTGWAGYGVPCDCPCHARPATT